MRIRRSISISVFILIVLSVLVFVAYPVYKRLKDPITHALTVIPDNAVMIIQLKDPQRFYQELNQTSTFWADLKKSASIKSLNLQLSYIDSLARVNEAFGTVLKENGAFISIHLSKSQKVSLLFLVEIPNATQQKNCQVLMGDIKLPKQAHSDRAYRQVDVEQIKITNYQKKLEFLFVKGLFVASFDPLLIEEAINKFSSGVSKPNESFVEVYKTANKNAPVNLFIKQSEFPALMKKLVGEKYLAAMNFFHSFSEWVELDIITRTNGLMLTGFASTNTSTSEYVDIFEGQSPDTLGLVSVLPYHTSFFMSWHYSDAKSFMGNWHTYLLANKLGFAAQQEKAAIDSTYQMKADEKILSWLGNEYALALIDPNQQDSISPQPIAVFKAMSEEIAKANMSELAQFVASRSSSPVFKPVDVDGFLINKLEVPHFLSAVFGPLFSPIQQNYYTILGNHVLWANDINTLVYTIKSITAQQTITQNPTFISLHDGLSNQSNMYMYCDVHGVKSSLVPFLNSEAAKQVLDFVQTTQVADAVGIQLNRTNDKTFVHVNIAKQNARRVAVVAPAPIVTTPVVVDTPKPVTAVATTKVTPAPQVKAVNSSNTIASLLEAPLAKQPTEVADYNDKVKKKIAIDKKNKLYFIHPEGRVEWTYALKEPIISDIHVVDLYKNNRTQYVFNTASYLYAFTREGKLVDGYPYAFKTKATAGVSVVDYDNSKNYRLLVPQGNTIANYVKVGEMANGWMNPSGKGKIVSPIQYVKSGGVDYLIAVDDLSKVLILDRKGAVKITLKEKIALPAGARFSAATATDGGVLRVTDAKGKVCVIKADGSVVRK